MPFFRESGKKCIVRVNQLEVSVMNHKDKIRVAVLFGGRSAEHEVSLRSAENIIKYLDSSRFEVIPVGITKQGSWSLGKDLFANSLEHNKVPQLQNNSAWFAPEWVGSLAKQQSTEMIPRSQSGKLFDVVFPAVHGSYCEDGTLQGLLELADLPFVGCGVLASAVGMDKDVSKRLVTHAGINVAPFISIKLDKWRTQETKCIDEILKTIKLPVFVKPVNTGSSIGITKVKEVEKLKDAINEAFRFDTKVLVEKALRVQELELAVLESLNAGEDPIVSVVGEIKPTHEFYSYDAKYMDENGAELIIPADLPEKTKKEAQEIAKKIFQVLECEGMARVDLFLDKDSGQIYFNEINTIPGFTKISMYPKLLEETGIEYKDLLTHLVQLALRRHESKSRIVRSYE
jgi:D-alanine-D-alanine ligase